MTSPHARRPAAPILLVVMLAIAVLFAGSSRLVAQDDASQAGSQLRDMEALKLAVAANPKPVILYFFNTKARPCHEMETKTFTDPGVVERMKEYHFVSLLDTQNRQLFSSYKLRKVPSIIFLDAQMQELDRAVGFKSADDFKMYLDRFKAAAAEGRSSRPADPSATPVRPFNLAAVDILKERPGTQPVRLTFTDEQAEEVFLCGDFNDWRQDANAMKKLEGGKFTITIHLGEGVYEYKFMTKDGRWFEDPATPYKKSNQYGGNNSVLIVGNPKRSPQVNGRTVTFILFDPSATRVQIGGSFNNWETLDMYKNPTEPGMWGVRYSLPPGRHSYKYIIDGKWVTDPENYTMIDDGSGVMNSSFEIQ